jgi:hypothetical protein
MKKCCIKAIESQILRKRLAIDTAMTKTAVLKLIISLHCHSFQLMKLQELLIN